MELGIYSKDGRLKLSVAPGDNGACSCGIQEESILAVSFTAFECIALEVYDYADFEGRRYWILERYLPQMNARREWAYSIRMSGAEGLAGQTLMVNPEDDDNPVLTLSAPAREHAALIVANMNRRTGTTEWKVGEVVVSEYIDIEYTGKYASDALSELSAAAKTEWWFDGMTLNISRCEFGECIPLSYGNGLIRNISRNIAEGVKFFTRLFPVGSSRNIDPDKYGHSRLQLPGGIRYVEQDTDLGIIEHFEQEAFERIFPRRIGTVGVVRHEERIGEDGKPFTVWYFTDPEIPFDPNQYEIGGLVKRITFQSGELLGREFEVNYDSQKKEFEIITQWPYDDDMQLPSEPLIPASGDEYVLWNISMPESYYPAAEQEFKTAVDTFMSENRKDVSVFQAQTDFTVIDQRALDLRPGQRIRLESAEYFPDTGFRETRIVSISRSVVRPGSMTLKMSDVLSTGRISRIESNIASVERLTKQVSSEFPDIIRSWEETPASDTTLYSSRKSEREFLNKRRGGTVEADVIFDKDITIGGSVVSKDFRQGDFSGSGFGAYRDENGNAVVEADILKIRKEAIFNEAVINQVTFRVGATVFSNGGCEITRVEELETAFRCYYDNREGRRYSGLTAGDQVRCQRYDPTQHAIIKYYWRLVTAVGEDYVELSKSDADGSASPEAGDEIAQFGNRSDITRQSAIVINPLDGGSVEVYAHIDAYSLSEKNYVGMGVNPQTGEAYMYAYGDMFFGDRDLADPNASWITYQKKEGEERRRLRIKADVTFGADSSGLGNLSEFKAQQQQIDNAQQTADDAQTTANEAQQAADEAARKAQEAKDYINSTLPGELAEINKKLDGVVENWFYDYTPTLENEPAASWIRDGEQAKHEGDTFTNTQEYVDNETTPDAGKSWRWVKDGSTWKWTPIADSDAVKALQQAAKAQETADGKNSNFVVQPTPPYAVGDFWSQGEGGQIMRCIKARASGSFDASDWAPAGDYYKYTDDKVDGIQIGSVNLIDGSERMVVPMGYGPNNFKAWPLGAVEAGERYAVSVESVELLTGDAVSGFDVQIWNSADGNVTTEASNRLTFPVGGPYTGVFEITATSSQAMLVLYSGVKTQAAGRSVAYNRLALVRGNKPALSWSPSIADQEKYTDDKVDGIQIGSVNLLDGSREFTVTAGSGDNYKFQVFDIGEVEAGEVFALSVENISVLAGTPGELSVRMYNEGASKDLANYVEISTEERTALFTIKSDVTKQKAKVLFYAGKYAATAGNSVRYEGAVLVRGNKPALSWSPSIADQEKYADQAVNGVETLIDASKLDQNTYYPVTIKLNGIARSKITVRVNLSDTQPGKPVWGTYNENRFSCQAVWYNNGNSWGSNYDKRIIEEYQYRWANYRPIGSVGQMGNSSNEYIYVRGGGVYRFFATNAGTPVLHTEAYTVNEQTIDLKTSVEPLVSLQEQANSTQQEAETTRKAIADMNDDTIFDVSEKQSIRTQWENISGYARTDVVLDSLSATNGSYYRVRDMAKAAGISTAGLLAAVNSLRVKLNDYALYTASNTPGFDRAGLAVLFTAYYAQEIDVLNAVSRKYTDGKVADIETSMQDYDYLKLVFPNNTVDNNGVFLSRLMAVKNGTSASAAVVAGLYGGGVDSLNNAGFKDATHGILMMFAGATSIQNVAAAKTRIYGDGTLYTSKLVAQAGTIAGFTIGTGYIGSENLTGSEYFYLSSSVIKNGKKDTYAMIGDTMYREKWKVAATLYNHYGSTGIGLVVDMGDNSHAAIYVPNGTFSGFRPMSRSYDNGTYTLHGNEEETVFFVNTSKGSTTFYLPSNPQPDQRYEIRKLHSGNSIIINAQNNGDIYVTGSNNPSSQISWTGRRCVTIQYSKNLDAWVMWFSYEA